MTELKNLIDKLDLQTKQALEQATNLCLQRGHYQVELSHWLLCIVEHLNQTDRGHLLALECDLTALRTDLQLNLERLKTGNEQAPVISNWFIELIHQAWLISSLQFTGEKVTLWMMLLALQQKDSLRQLASGLSAQLKKLSEQSSTLLSLASQANKTETPPDTIASQAASALTQYAINLNHQAQAGHIDPAIGREQEISQLIQVLGRRRQNNVMLTGEPGVGKTALVEGLALRIINKQVPKSLEEVTIYALDLGLLQAGASVKGEFEQRLKNIIKDIQASLTPIILFIDEAHGLIGAGNNAGQNDAANLLKPTLARGELRAIAATTWHEYKRYIEQDPALGRRFQVIKIEEPTPMVCCDMLRSIASGLEQHHQVIILEEALTAASELSAKYIQERQLPDKAISVIDTACARVASEQATQPTLIHQLQQNLAQLAAQAQRLQQEQLSGSKHQRRLKIIKQQQRELNRQLKTAKTSHAKQKQLVAELLRQRTILLATDDKQKQTVIRRQLQQLERQLQQFSEEQMVSPYVDQASICQIIADWTGIPAGRLQKTQLNAILHLAQTLKQQVIGQDVSIDDISQAFKTAGAKLNSAEKPLGIFLLVGPSGVGKTETALALAEEVYGSRDNVTTINMSEFKEAHRVSTLTGSPPGYIGYGDGGMLTEAVRRKPYSLILLDEMEKAHPSVQDIFYQVFDKGIIHDGQGRQISFKNTIILMTANSADEDIRKLCQQEQYCHSNTLLRQAIHQQLSKTFKPAFLGRVNIIPYRPLNEQALQEVMALKLKKIQRRAQQNQSLTLHYGHQFITRIVHHCQQHTLGARQIDAVIEQTILPLLSEHLLQHMVANKQLKSITLDSNQHGELIITHHD